MSKETQTHIYPIMDRLQARSAKERQINQRGGVYWMTGYSGSGKSTIAISTEAMLMDSGRQVVILDGDNVRSGINADLQFSIEDRRENIRRVAEIAKLFCHQGWVVLTSFISPTREIRAFARRIIGAEDFHEIFIDTPLELCEKRDVKQLYKKARAGEIKDFTGIDSPYEAPEKPALRVPTKDQSIEASSQLVFNFIMNNSQWNEL